MEGGPVSMFPPPLLDSLGSSHSAPVGVMGEEEGKKSQAENREDSELEGREGRGKKEVRGQQWRGCVKMVRRNAGVAGNAGTVDEGGGGGLRLCLCWTWRSEEVRQAGDEGSRGSSGWWCRVVV